MLLTWTGVPAGEIREHATGAEFPREVTFEYDGRGYELRATGLAVRRVAFFKVYAMVHYAQAAAGLDRGMLLEQIRAGDVPLQVTMHFTRNIAGERIGDSLVESIRRNAPEDTLREAAEAIASFAVAVRHDVQKGERFTLRRLPDGTTACIFNDVPVMVVQNRAFGRALWSIWFGERSVVDREKLLDEYAAGSG